MAVTALIWPRFSTTRMITTGTIMKTACALNCGAAKFGIPIHAALATPLRSTGLPRPMPLVSTA
ncbi:hypothetical protein D3C72_1696060 [compost metagenome]